MQLFTLSSSIRVAALACGVLLGACAKKDDNPTPTPANSSISWTVDNASYTSASADVTVQGTDMLLTGIASAPGSTNNAINLIVPAATGTYNLAGAPANANYLLSYSINSSSANPTTYIASSLLGNGTGVVTVTTYSATEVMGTFSFTGSSSSGSTGTKVITNGKFSVKR